MKTILVLLICVLILGIVYQARPEIVGRAAPAATDSATQAGVFWQGWTIPSDISASPADQAIYPILGMDASGAQLYLAWSDGRDDVHNIYYTSSADMGWNWQEPQALWKSNYDSVRPSMIISGTTPIFAWADEFASINLTTHHMALGASAPFTVPNDYTVLASTPHLTLDPDNELHLAMQGGTSNHTNILYSHWRSGMTTWPPATIVFTPTAVGSSNPAIVVNDQYIHLVWQEKYSANESLIYYMRGQRNGNQINWDQAVPLSDPTVISVRPVIVLQGDAVHLAWGEQLDADRYKIYLPLVVKTADVTQSGASRSASVQPNAVSTRFNWQYIRYSRSDDGGLTWSQPVRVDPDPVRANNVSPTDVAPIMAVSPEGTICIAWHGFYRGVTIEAEEIYLSCSTEKGIQWSWSKPVNVSRSPNLISIRPNLLIDPDGALHIVWQELAHTNANPLEEYQIHYARSLPHNLMLPIIRRHNGE